MRWRLMRGEALLGELAEDGCDMPFSTARFEAGAGWGEVRAHFDALNALSGPDPDGVRTAAVLGPIIDLGLTLVPDGGGQALGVWRKEAGGTCFLRIDGARARMRY
ncbi:hypothetical protein [Kitasatospora terrestris]|uniref:Uncharacterized protein n=1 Tax=Kitasatospora terrestris TaxID=258051 RepID=A0ABP9ETB9_9ACTN